jgi:hypothetical protein
MRDRKACEWKQIGEILPSFLRLGLGDLILVSSSAAQVWGVARVRDAVDFGVFVLDAELGRIGEPDILSETRISECDFSSQYIKSVGAMIR